METKRQAIENYCKGCIYDPLDDGTWRAQVEKCTVLHCELYNHRPLTQATTDRLKQERVEAMSPEERAKYQAKQDKARESFGRVN